MGDTAPIKRPYSRKPQWLRIQLTQSAAQNKSFRRLRSIMRSKQLNTVCEEARCPNIHECWGTHATATFMVLGDTCTRRCRFCSIQTGLPRGIDVAEPRKVGAAVAEMQLAHVVITMVNRDDLADGGAAHVAATVRAIRDCAPRCTVEVLSSDLMGDRESIAIMMESKAEIMSHNIETVRRLTPLVRSRSEYQRSLSFLRIAKELDPQAITKSSMMLGLGEQMAEVTAAMDDLLAHNVTVLNLGQYLQPTRAHLAVQRWWTPDEFATLKAIALDKGFHHCEAGALVRSSYHADAQYDQLRRRRAEAAHPPVDTEHAAAGRAAWRRAVHPLYRDPELAEKL